MDLEIHYRIKLYQEFSGEETKKQILQELFGLVFFDKLINLLFICPMDLQSEVKPKFNKYQNFMLMFL